MLHSRQQKRSQRCDVAEAVLKQLERIMEVMSMAVEGCTKAQVLPKVMQEFMEAWSVLFWHHEHSMINLAD